MYVTLLGGCEGDMDACSHQEYVSLSAQLYRVYKMMGDIYLLSKNSYCKCHFLFSETYFHNKLNQWKL